MFYWFKCYIYRIIDFGIRTIFSNPFDSTELNEKVDAIVLKIGPFDYIFARANVSSTEIDFDGRNIRINNSLDSTAMLRETIRAFFIIVANELSLNKEFPNGKQAHLDDIAYAHLSWLFMNWFEDNTFEWKYNAPYPDIINVGTVRYSIEAMKEISYQSTQCIQYGVSDHVLGRIYIIESDRGVIIPNSIKNQTFWHEYVHCLFVQTNETYANDIEYVVDAYATQIALFMKQFETFIND